MVKYAQYKWVKVKRGFVKNHDSSTCEFTETGFGCSVECGEEMRVIAGLEYWRRHLALSARTRLPGFAVKASNKSFEREASLLWLSPAVHHSALHLAVI